MSNVVTVFIGAPEQRLFRKRFSFARDGGRDWQRRGRFGIQRGFRK